MNLTSRKQSLILISVLAACISYGWNTLTQSRTTSYQPQNSAQSALTPYADKALLNAIAQHRENIHTEGVGVVVNVLPDDNKGSRHQRFIMRINDNQGQAHRILIAHNIDLAGKVSNLNTGDLIGFNGIYIWNEKGGVIHWTHRDPQHHHPDGWLQHNGQRYQ